MAVNLIEGKLPPSSPETEQAILGACLLERSGVSMVADILSEEMFYEERHRVTFGAIMRLYRDGGAIDLVTVSSELLKSKKLEVAGGAHYLTTLTNKVSSSANVQYHARIVVELWIKREVIKMSHDLLNRAWDASEDVFDLLGSASKGLQDIYDRAEVRDAERADDMSSVIDMDKGETNAIEVTEIDRYVSNRNGKMIVVGARPGVGKSLFGQMWALGMGRLGPGLFLSLEMDTTELRSRLAACLGGINISHLLEARASEAEIQRVHQMSVEHNKLLKNILIDDTAEVTPSMLMGKVERAVTRYGAKWAVVDYLQLIAQERGGKRLSEYERVTEASRSVAMAAKRNNIPILALSQLRRKDGTNPEPLMSDLRSSGQIEQDAYSIILLHRPGYDQYPPPEFDRLSCWIAKNRNGSMGKVDIPFYGAYGQIGPYVSSIQQPTASMPRKSSAGTRTDDDGDPAPF